MRALFTTNAAGLCPALIVVMVWLLSLTLISGCSSSSTTTTVEEKPATPVTDPAVTQTINAFMADDNGDGVDVVVKANGTEVNDGDNITVDRGNPVVQIGTSIYGLGVYDPELKDRKDRLNITDAQLLPEKEPICGVAIVKDTELPVQLDPSDMDEVVAPFDLSDEQEDYGNQIVYFSVTGSADQPRSLVWTARRMGLKPMPSTGATVITTTTVTKKDNNDWIVAGVIGLAGLAIGTFTGNPGLGLAIACGDPHETIQFSVTIPGRLGDTPPVTPVNQSPNAVVTASPTSGSVPLTVNFDASGSSDSDGTIVRFEWDYDGDGDYDFDSNTDATVSYNYTVAGTYAAKVRVTDNDGATDTASVGGGLTVTSILPVNQLPVAVMAEVPPSGVMPLTVAFNGSGSYDPDGEIVRWEWFINNISAHLGASFSHTFQTAGDYSVVLEVEDNNGATDRSHWTITVSAGSTQLELVDDSLTNESDGTTWRFVTFQIKEPLPAGIGFLNWEPVTGPTGWSTLPEPEGVHPQLICKVYFLGEGNFQGRVTPYASEQAFDSGQPALGEPVYFTLTVGPPGSN